MKWKIIPNDQIVAVLESADEGTALCCFAACMESDMSAYFKAVPISEEEYVTLEIEGYAI